MAGDGGGRAPPHPAAGEEAGDRGSGRLLTGAAGDRAGAAVLRADDLPGVGWEAVGDDTDDGGGDAAGADPALDACLGDLPDDRLLDAAESPRFRRGEELAWSVAWVLDGKRPAATVRARLAEADFAGCFVAGVAAGVDPSVVAAVTATDRHELSGGWVVHRARVSGGTEVGLGDVHLALLAGGAGPVAALVVLAGVDPPAPEVAAGVAARLDGRLPRR